MTISNIDSEIINRLAQLKSIFTKEIYKKVKSGQVKVEDLKNEVVMKMSWAFL